MEASIHYFKKSMYSSMDSKLDLPCLDLFKITSETNKPCPQMKFASLNTLCSELNFYPNSQNERFKPLGDIFESDFQAILPENKDGIQQILKTIPIYSDLKSSVEAAKPSPLDMQSEHSGYELAPSGHADWNQWYEQHARLSRGYENEKGSNLIPGNWSSLNTVVSSGSSPDNSHPLHEENIMKSMYLTNEAKRNFAEGSNVMFNMHMNSYVSQAHALTPIIVPEGSSLYVPPGYIRVDAQKSSVRTTKQITNCEHVNRRHYAKGLCSTCYHKGGRTKLAWNCEHTDRLHYAKGCCCDCYVQFHSTRGKGKGKNKVSSEPNVNRLNQDKFNF